MKTLLEKSRNINRLLQKAAGHPVDFKEMACVLAENINANCYIVGRKGKILGHCFMKGFHCDVMEDIVMKEGRIPAEFNEELLRIAETKANTSQTANACLFIGQDECIYNNKLSTFVPINGGGQRLGTLILAKFNVQFTNEDLILAEYGATVVGMEILRSKAERIEEEARKKAAVHIALATLSYSEMEAIEHIFSELDGNEGVLVASKIADRAGITRSVIVNALRKFESAGVIESKSLGMKGTYIRVLNDNLLEEIEKMKR
ncbi:MAG: GTP-sensing pleiotropic transcriptional regulator CodY [Thermoanaerobacteraceae bacterium]|nr:GTP-sensing pleiotropic transcriptional regulator CodY [Thermoanaerobacteraceae bacterium]